ncbi:MAG TPA: hypothetical protein VFV34_25530 [Blastocatellia bacterium]|nr:hypothetical protein [Blastocatellia bacterium]
MRTPDTARRLSALVAITATLMVAVGAIAANTGQDQIAARAHVSPQAREDKDELAIVFQGGIAHGQTLRFNVIPLATVNPGPPRLELTVFDSQGRNTGADTVIRPEPKYPRPSRALRSQRGPVPSREV